MGNRGHFPDCVDSFGTPIEVGDAVFRFSKKRYNIAICKVASIYETQHYDPYANSINNRSKYTLKLQCWDEDGQLVPGKVHSPPCAVLKTKDAKSMLVKTILKS